MEVEVLAGKLSLKALHLVNVWFDFDLGAHEADLRLFISLYYSTDLGQKCVHYG